MAFPLELDHIVIFSRVDAPEAQALEALGLTGFGGTTRHGDLGTASTSFFFENAYLELLWVSDEAAARKAFLPLDFDLHTRMTWRESGTVPFGLMLRHRAGPTAPNPFPTRQLKADWMPGEVYVHFSAAVLAEPYYGIVPESLAYDSFKATIPVQSHPLGVKRLTKIRLAIPTSERSPAASLLAANGMADIETAAAPLMELTFDDGVQGKVVDARDTLPLRLIC